MKVITINMTDKPFLYTLESGEIDKIPPKSVECFCTRIQNENVLPSKALRLFLAENDITDRATSLIFSLIKIAFPGISLFGITFPITDSNYPFCDANALNDEGFDELILTAWRDCQEAQ